MRPFPLISAGLLLAAGSARGAEWRKDFELRDHMRIYDFPEELVSYPVTFPAKTVLPRELRLEARHIDPPRPTIFQLSEVQAKDGFLNSALVSFNPSRASPKILTTDMPLSDFGITCNLAIIGHQRRQT